MGDATAAAGATRFRRLEKVGEGTFGSVFRAIVTATGQQVAYKKLKLGIDDEGLPYTMIREVAILKELAHPNIVELKAVELGADSLGLIFEWIDMDLLKCMRSSGVMTLPLVKARATARAKSYMYQLLLGTAYCHVRGVVHRDLKPQNLLVDRKGVLKVADFGLARAVYIPMKAYTHEVVTLWYRAPEILLGQHVYSYGVDVWSIGAIFAELLNNAPLWPGAYELDQLLRIFRTLGTPTEETWSGLAELPDYTPAFPSWAARPLSAVCPTLDAAGLDLLGRMLAYDPAARISCRAALEHPWFDDVDASAKVRYM